MRRQEKEFLLNFYLGRDLKIMGIPLKDRLTVGRELSNGVILPDRTVSHRHATFYAMKEREPPRVILRDEGSKNGCVVNGYRLKGEAMAVRTRDQIRIGGFRVELVESTDSASCDDPTLALEALERSLENR